MSMMACLTNTYVLNENGKPIHIAVQKKPDPAIIGNYIFHTSSHQNISWPAKDAMCANDKEIERSIKASTPPLWLLE